MLYSLKFHNSHGPFYNQNKTVIMILKIKKERKHTAFLVYFFYTKVAICRGTFFLKYIFYRGKFIFVFPE